MKDNVVGQSDDSSSSRSTSPRRRARDSARRTLAEVTGTGVEEEGFSRPTRCHDGQGGPVPVNTFFLPSFFLKQLKTFKSALYHDR